MSPTDDMCILSRVGAPGGGGDEQEPGNPGVGGGESTHYPSRFSRCTDFSAKISSQLFPLQITQINNNSTNNKSGLVAVKGK